MNKLVEVKEGEKATDLIEITGTVKWFDVGRGFGFIVPDNGLPDVFLHTKRLAAAGHRVIFEGSRVRCRAFRRGAGFFASEILNVDHSKAVEPRQGALHWHHSVTPESNWERVKVKWFDHRRGFGFVTRAADQPDCFFHIETLRQAALASYPMPGDVLEVRYGTGPKGRVVTQMRSMPAQTVQAAE